MDKLIIIRVTVQVFVVLLAQEPTRGMSYCHPQKRSCEHAYSQYWYCVDKV